MILRIVTQPKKEKHNLILDQDTTTGHVGGNLRAWSGHEGIFSTHQVYHLWLTALFFKHTTAGASPPSHNISPSFRPQNSYQYCTVWPRVVIRPHLYLLLILLVERYWESSYILSVRLSEWMLSSGLFSAYSTDTCTAF